MGIALTDFLCLCADDEDDVDDMYGDSKGIIFSVGGEKEESLSETTPRNPDCFAWCLINLCISKLTQQMVRKMVSGVGLEVLGEMTSILQSLILYQPKRSGSARLTTPTAPSSFHCTSSPLFTIDHTHFSSHSFHSFH